MQIAYRSLFYLYKYNRNILFRRIKIKEKSMEQLIDTIKYWADKYAFDEEDSVIAEEIIAQLVADKEEFDEDEEDY